MNDWRPQDWVAYAWATWFGCGASPVAPGTVGTLGALPLYSLLRRASALNYWAFWVATVLTGIWASERVARRAMKEDPSWVVVDEVAGVLLALGLVRRRRLGHMVASIALFRILDIAKPGFIRKSERIKPAGLGIMVDDLLAGLGAGLLARLL